MKRSLAKASTIVALSMLAAVLSCNSATAAEYWGDQMGPAAPSAPFKLHARHNTFPSDLIITETSWRPPRKVDGVLVRQISEVRSALPNWTGLHHVTPGASGSGR